MYDTKAARYPLIYFISLKYKQFAIPLLFWVPGLQLSHTMRIS